MRTSRATSTPTCVAFAACMGLALAAPALAQSMKTSNDNAALKQILRCDTAVQVAPGGGQTQRNVGPIKPTLTAKAQLSIGSSTTWVVEGGDPLMVTYCVAPAVQNTGNAPWTQPLRLKLVDQRTVDYVNEDPFAQDILTPKPNTGELKGIPHAPAVFPLVQVPVPVVPGPWVAVPVPANGWCRTVAWYQRPDLRIQVSQQGAAVSCPVQFSSPLSRIKPNQPPPKN